MISDFQSDRFFFACGPGAFKRSIAIVCNLSAYLFLISATTHATLLVHTCAKFILQTLYLSCQTDFLCRFQVWNSKRYTVWFWLFTITNLDKRSSIYWAVYGATAILLSQSSTFGPQMLNQEIRFEIQVVALNGRRTKPNWCSAITNWK